MGLDTNDGRCDVDARVDISGSCERATTKSIRFAISELTSCQMQLDLSRFSDCAQLRSDTSELVESFVPADFVGLVRSPDAANMSHWAPIHRQTFPLMGLLQLRYEHDSATTRYEMRTIRIRFERDTTSYEELCAFEQ